MKTDEIKQEIAEIMKTLIKGLLEDLSHDDAMPYKVPMSQTFFDAARGNLARLKIKATPKITNESVTETFLAYLGDCKLEALDFPETIKEEHEKLIESAENVIKKIESVLQRIFK